MRPTILGCCRFAKEGSVLGHPHTKIVSIHGLKGVESAFHSKGSTLKRTNALRQKLRKSM